MTHRTATKALKSLRRHARIPRWKVRSIRSYESSRPSWSLVPTSRKHKVVTRSGNSAGGYALKAFFSEAFGSFWSHRLPLKAVPKNSKAPSFPSRERGAVCRLDFHQFGSTETMWPTISGATMARGGCISRFTLITENAGFASRSTPTC